MKKLITLAVFAALALTAGNALAIIDGAGNVWPLHGANLTPTGPVSVYVAVNKAGVTDAVGQGADIQVEMSVANDIGGTDNVVFVYNTDVGGGADDEYTGQIAQTLLLGASTVTVDFVVTDLSDGTTYDGTITDQQANPAPLTYNVVDVLPNNVDVTFTLCMSGEITAGPPCVIGSAPEIGSWGTGVLMNSLGGDLYEVTVTFASGGNPTFEYKFKKDACINWESVDNRVVTLPTDGTTAVTLDWDSWNNLPMGCGQEQYLTEDKVLCFQVCMSEVGTAGSVCAIGSLPELTGWSTGVPTVQIASDLYQACVVIPAGTAIPVTAEYKFKKDDCDTWESVGNRTLVIDNSLAPETTLSHNWDDGAGACDTVDADDTSWGSIKSMFR